MSKYYITGTQLLKLQRMKLPKKARMILHEVFENQHYEEDFK